MQNRDFEPGTVVRYASSLLAVVRRTVDGTADVEFASGKRITVGASQLTNFFDELRKRSRVMSLSREKLCELLYLEARSRLTPERVREMKRFLRKSGLYFTPENWSAGSNIQLSVDDSFVRRDKSAKDHAFEELLPQWLLPHRLPPGSRDPLGFQAYAEKLANELLPGLTVFTSRIGYYGFLAWTIRELNRLEADRRVRARDRFHRLERLLALCEFIAHGKEDNDCRLLGSRSKTEILQSAQNDRFALPRRILKNQDSAGALRLYATSMVSTGFATAAPELEIDNHIPFELTELGESLAKEFGKCVPKGFLKFALDGTTLPRSTLMEWGGELCFSGLGRRAGYRERFLDGFLKGGTHEAEARFRTVKTLFKHKLLRPDGSIPKRRSTGVELMTEDDAELSEELDDFDGLSNADVLLYFYEAEHAHELLPLQKAAVFSALSLAHTAIFAYVLRETERQGRASLAGLGDSVCAAGRFGKKWSLPFSEMGHRADSVRELVSQLFDAYEEPALQAAIGGVLLARIRADRLYARIGIEISDAPPLVLVERILPDVPLGETWPALVSEMVERHNLVSLNKSRQRWCYLEGAEVVKDDPRKFGPAWHAMRFPQLFSLCRDLELLREDLNLES
jgi:hypothetical protein